MSMLLDLSRLRTGVDRLTRRFQPDEFGLAEEEFRDSALYDADHAHLLRPKRAARLADC